MKPQIHLAGKWWPLQKEHLKAMEAACHEEWEFEAVQVLSEWWSSELKIASSTSGSTGTPKEIWHHKKSMVESALRTIGFFDLNEGTTASLVMPARFIGGKMMLIRAIVGGWRIRIERPSRLPALGVSCDFVAMTAAQAFALCKERPDVWSQLQMVLLGGSAVDRHVIQQMPEGPVVYESFGMTETISHFAVRQLKPNLEEIFRCLEGFEVRSHSDGTLEVILPDGTSIKTNDIADVNSSTTFQWLGRRDDVINSGGIKIHPEQVEKALAAVIPYPFKAFGQPHPTLGTQLVLRVHVPAPPVDALQLETKWITWAKQNLPRHHAPKKVEWKELNQTASGKWMRP